MIPTTKFNRLAGRVEKLEIGRAGDRGYRGTFARRPSNCRGMSQFTLPSTNLAAGRHFYAPLLHEAFPNGWVRVIREGPTQCEYAIDNLDRDVQVRFEPRADGAHLNVALASMAAKYLREVCMIQFNRYWAAKVAGLRPTAGYPMDASRFFAEIQPCLTAEGTDRRTVWRTK